MPERAAQLPVHAETGVPGTLGQLGVGDHVRVAEQLADHYPAAGPYDAAELSQRGDLVRDLAQDRHEVRAVEGVVRERQLACVGAGGLAQYLFGSLTTVTRDDLKLVGVLAIVILVTTLGLSPQLYAVATDEEFARTQGLRVRLYHIAVVTLAAVTVANHTLPAVVVVRRTCGEHRH